MRQVEDEDVSGAQPPAGPRRLHVERAALDRTPVRDIVGEDPVAFVEEFKANYGLGSWISKEQRRLIDAIAAAEAATGEGEPS